MLLRQLLYRTETRLLPVIAGFWLRLPDKTNYEEIIRLLCIRMLDNGILNRMISGASGKEITTGLSRLIGQNGTISADAFEEEFGTLRIAGIDKVLREKYWKNPISITEILYYRGLIFRAPCFIESTVKECYVIPDDLIKMLREMIQTDQISAGNTVPEIIVRPAIPSETVLASPVNDRLPETVTLCAAQKRSEKPFELPNTVITGEYESFVHMILQNSGMFPASGAPDSEAIRSFLISNRTSARLQLINTWRYSSSYDELEEDKTDLIIEEHPVYDPAQPRDRILKLLTLLEPDIWWSLNGFITAVKNADGTFLRKHFKNESWIIHDKDGNDLTGQGSWFQLEGAYIRFLLFGPLQWLGIIQCAYADKEKTEPAAFRITGNGLFYILESQSPELSEEISTKQNLETTVPRIAADGAVICSSGTSRYFLYMAARFMEIEKFTDTECAFRLTPDSLAEAEKNGLTRESLLSMLRRFSKNTVPPSLERMLSAPRSYSIPATIYNATILTVPDPNIVEDIINSPRLSKWVIQQINSNSLVIDSKGITDIRRFLMEKEIFVDIKK